MASATLQHFLDEQKVAYQVIPHETAYTAQVVAGVTHTPGRELAKAVMVKLDGELVMAVVPAMYRVDLAALRRVAGAQSAELAPEAEFYQRFSDCETGAMPPFGNLYGVRVFADKALTYDTQITFNACTHREAIRMTWSDFERLADPKIAAIAAHPGADIA